MDPDRFQKAWQVQGTEARVTVDPDQLLSSEVQRNQKDFIAKIRRRDFTEIAVGLLLLPIWFYLGAKIELPWTWYLTVPAILWGIGFFLVDRIRYPRKLSQPGESLLSCIKNSLAQVEHQIWLLCNIFWWYLLPPTLSILAFLSHLAWLASESWLDTLEHALGFVFLFVLYYFVYWFNQRAVATDLEPRRQELLRILESLEGEQATNQHVAASQVRSITSSQLLRRWAIGTATCLIAVVGAAAASGIFAADYQGTPQYAGPDGEALGRLVAEQRKAKNLVGLAAMVMVDGKVTAEAADGERKHGSGVSLGLGDQWHLGGITKSITATLIARLVESGQMQWSDTVGSVLAKDNSDSLIDPAWSTVTLRQLLTHTAGAQANFSLEIRRKQPAIGVECTRARHEAIRDVIAEPPAFPPGKKYLFSNVGYTIAGAMAELATGDSWEELVKREVFKPLQLTSAGFGPPLSPDPIALNPGLDQPRGHRTFFHGKVAVSDQVDNTPIMGPAGNVHLTLYDLCTYATEHLLGTQGSGNLLADETYKLLHTPELNNYACGWMKHEPEDEPQDKAQYTIYWHNGSNTMWHALVVFVPEKKMVVAVAANDGDLASSESAAWEIVNANIAHNSSLRGPVQVSDYAKKSPFAAVRWNEGKPEVKIGGVWYQLLSIDGITTTEILAFSQQQYGELSEKRFDEDLVELLTRMGNPPQDTVDLVVRSLAANQPQTLLDVPMTEANRREIRNHRQQRER